MPLKSEPWFPSIIWSGMIDGLDHEQIKKYAYDLKSKSPGVKISNYGGWQSDSLSGTVDKEIILLINEITRNIDEVCQQVSLPNLELWNIWINVNNPGSYNQVHHHMNSTISGVYYVKVPENSGGIEFFRNDEADYYIPPGVQQYNYFNSTKVTYRAVEGALLLFPGWLRHSVQQNQSQEDRISISFNYGVKNEN